MTSWAPEQRNQVIFITLITFGLAGLIWFGVISRLTAEVGQVQKSVASAQLEFDKVKISVREESRYQNDLDVYNGQLQELESTMARGDVGVWLLTQKVQWAAKNRTWIIEAKPVGSVAQEVPPALPYEWYRYSLNGAGCYHDIGSMIAYIENSSPFLRVVDLNISSKNNMLVGATSEDWLAFKLELVGLVITNRP